MFNIDYEFLINHYIKNNNITNHIEYIVDKLSCENNIKEFLTKIFEKTDTNDFIIIVDGIVYNNDDAYINTIYATLYPDFKRIYQANEILDIANKFASLEYFIKFQGKVKICNVDNKLIDDIPQNIKNNMLIMENNNINAINQNFAIYVFKKY